MTTSNSESGAAADKKRPKYLTKVVKFGKENLTLYSIDGNTWSSRRQELTEIMNRHEQERLKSIQAMGEPLEGEKGPAGEDAEEEPEKSEAEPQEKDVELEKDLDAAADLAELDEEGLLDDALEDEDAPKVGAKTAAKLKKAPKAASVAGRVAAAPKVPAKKASKSVAAPKTAAKKKPAKSKK